MAVVLVVEDDDAIRATICGALEDAGHVVTTAQDGRAALDYLDRAGPPDLIILDLLMPVLDGWGFRIEQLARPEIRDVPVIVLSASHAASGLPAAFDAAAHLPKPFDLDTLLQTVGRLVS